MQQFWVNSKLTHQVGKGNRPCSEEEKTGTNRCSPVFCSLMISKQSCELSRHRNWINNRLAVFWLFVMFAESQIEASERDQEYCKNGCKTFFLGNL